MEINQIIDPPVSAYSSAKDIKAWLGKLQEMEQTDEVKLAINDAQEWLNSAEKREAE